MVGKTFTEEKNIWAVMCTYPLFLGDILNYILLLEKLKITSLV
jgi:hypothetical protein